MKQFLRTLAVFTLVTLGLGLTPAEAGEDLAAGSDWSTLALRMEAEGWRRIQTKVFERQLGDHKVEHLGYGPEGLSWTIGELNRHLDYLLKQYDLFPTDELAKTIDGLTATIAKAHRELNALSRASKGVPAEGLSYTGASCDSICYGATADAYHQTAQQGVGAFAQARFNNACGHGGETYAYAYAQATQGTTFTTYTQTDGPKPGTAIVSTAQASLAGGSGSLPCQSSAAAYAQSTALEISYITSDFNDGYCPVPPAPVPTLYGTNYEYFTVNGCRSRTWTSSVTGGVAPFTYQWTVNGTVVGTGSSYTRSICATSGSFTLGLRVTGANGVSGTTSQWVEVYYEYIDPCLYLPVCP